MAKTVINALPTVVSHPSSDLKAGKERNLRRRTPKIRSDDGGELVVGGEPVAGKLSATLEGKAVEVAYTLVRPAH